MNPVKLLGLGLCLLAASDVAFALAQSPVMLLAAVILFGLHLGATQGIFSTLISLTAPQEVRASAFGLFNFFSGLALLAGGLIAGSLWQLWGAQYCFAGAALFALATLTYLCRHPNLVQWHK